MNTIFLTHCLKTGRATLILNYTIVLFKDNIDFDSTHNINDTEDHPQKCDTVIYRLMVQHIQCTKSINVDEHSRQCQNDKERKKGKSVIEVRDSRFSQSAKAFVSKGVCVDGILIIHSLMSFQLHMHQLKMKYVWQLAHHSKK